VHLPKRQTKALLQLFLGILIIGIIFLLGVSFYIPTFSSLAPQRLSEYLNISLFFISLTLAYITTYSAVEVDSPSLVMIMSIYKAGKRGQDEKDFLMQMNNDILIKPRIIDLLRDEFIFMDKDTYKLTKRCTLFVSIFIFYRKLLNLGKGG
jgi:hypothetical protein